MAKATATAELAISRDIPAIVAEEYRELSDLATDRLRDELASTLHLSAAYLRRLAVIVRLLEERGEDLSELKIDLLPYLRLIAHGQLLPELLVRHGHSPQLLRVARSLPLPDQGRLAKGDHVPLVVRRDDGTFDHRMADPGFMSRDQITQVFGTGRIRAVEEQILILEARGKPKAPKEAADKDARVRPDRERGGIVVGRTFVPLPDVLAALAAVAGEPDDPDDEDSGERKAINVQFPLPQYERLRKIAFERNTKMATLVKRALAAYGLI